MNPKGTPGNLIAKQPGNKNAQRHGAYAETASTELIAGIVDAIMSAPHLELPDRIAVEELARLLILRDAIDTDLAKRGLLRANLDARVLVDVRLRLSGKVDRLLRELGLTPAARAKWAGASSSSVILEFRRLQEIQDDPA